MNGSGGWGFCWGGCGKQVVMDETDGIVTAAPVERQPPCGVALMADDHQGGTLSVLQGMLTACEPSDHLGDSPPLFFKVSSVPH